MTTSTVTHLDEQHDETDAQEQDDFPTGMLASPTRTRL